MFTMFNTMSYTKIITLNDIEITDIGPLLITFSDVCQSLEIVLIKGPIFVIWL